MRKYKNIIITAVVIIAVLAAAFALGGRYSVNSRRETPSVNPVSTAVPDGTNPDSPTAMVIDPETGKDRYLTDPVPDGKPLPAEPQDAIIGENAYTCFLSVSCATILDNMNLLDKEKHELVPEDGVIFPLTEVTFYEGESVFNVLQREMKSNRIHLEFVNVPIYNSVYIEGMNNLYEFDVGELSGWMYKVNEWFPNYGASRYRLQPGDVVEWVYTCDLGRDVGGWGSINGYVTGADWLKEIGYEEEQE
jgi:hypothetical protein